MTISTEDPWSGAYKIPWDEPGFSKRMLAEHLSQEHDLASRRVEWIDRQVEWIHDELLGAKPSRILDLGCGPGFYAHRLAKRGHRVLGIDFGPASIEYARANSPDASRCEFVHSDIRGASFRGASFRGPYDLAMLLYGEFNVFPPEDAANILGKAHSSLDTGGVLLIEVQTPAAVEGIGRAEDSEQVIEAGLFSDRPHTCRTENRWLGEHNVAVQTFTIVDREAGERREYRSTTKAWADDELRDAVLEAGFATVEARADWPCNTDGLSLWIARRT